MLHIDTNPNFDSHRALFVLLDSETRLKSFIAIHRGGIKKPAFGATRIWKYSSDEEALEDVLKLSRGMSYKSALAGLAYGGAKAVIVLPEDDYNLTTLLASYSKHLQYLTSHFITGADVGVGAAELSIMAKANKAIVGIRSDPVYYTALGVYYAIQTTLEYLYHNQSVQGRRFAIQGLGKTGRQLAELLAENGADIWITDVDNSKVQSLQSQHPQCKVVQPEEIYSLEVDIFSPCALSNIVSSETVAKMHCKAIVGSANAQLASASVGDHLLNKGILYAPDYLINAGGLITVVDEYENRRSNKQRIIEKVEKIKRTLMDVYKTSAKMNTPTNVVADRKAEKIITAFT